MKKKSVYEIIDEYCKSINKLEPTYEEIEAFIMDLENTNSTYGIVTYNKKDDNPLIIRFHDTWRKKFGGRTHIDVISGEYHLMLDKDTAPWFIEFIEKKRNN